MAREFTGRDMTMVMVAGFGVVAAVNFLMAGLATSGFGGVVVENSYVASQKFNAWLEQAEQSRALGWQVDIARDSDSHLTVETNGVPSTASVVAELRRPLGTRETHRANFVPVGEDRFRSVEPVPGGRWTARLKISAGSSQWANEVPLP